MIVIQLKETNIQKIKLIPKRFFNKCWLYLQNELTGLEHSFLIDMINKNGVCILRFELDVLEGDSFSILITSQSGKTELYRGKAYATSQEDLQEFQLSPKENKIII